MRNIISTFAIAAGFSLMGGAIAQAGDVTEKRDLSSFEKIVIVDTGVEIDIKVGKPFSVTLEGTEKWAKRLTTHVRGNALVIGWDGEDKKSITWKSNNKIIVTMPKFTSLEVNGAVDAEITGIDSEKVEFEINGAGNIEVEGKCGDLEVDFNGAGNFEGRDLKCRNVSVEINGAGNAEVYASDEAELEIGGFGNIDVYGQPKHVSKDSHMFSNITVHKK